MGECDQKNHRWAEQQPRIYPLMSGRISHFYEALSKCEPAQQAGVVLIICTSCPKSFKALAMSHMRDSTAPHPFGGIGIRPGPIIEIFIPYPQCFQRKS